MYNVIPYLQAFQPEVWLTLFVCVNLVAACMFIIDRYFVRGRFGTRPYPLGNYLWEFWRRLFPQGEWVVWVFRVMKESNFFEGDHNHSHLCFSQNISSDFLWQILCAEPITGYRCVYCCLCSPFLCNCWLYSVVCWLQAWQSVNQRIT